jgi:hypothetical protein
MAAPKRAPVPDARRDLHKELAAAAALKHQLAKAFGDEQDLTLLRDTIEGETGLDGAIDKVLEQMTLDLANIHGIEKFETMMAARRKRLADRVETLRGMLLNALDILEAKSMERPMARLSLRPVPPKLLITDEAAIPTRFYKQPDPELSKKDLTDFLKSRRDMLAEKLEEIAARLKAGALSDEAAQSASAAAIEAFPPIPGAELDNGSTTIQVKWT